MSYIPPKFQARIKEAKEEGLKELDLSNDFSKYADKLKEIPAEVFELEQLESLNLNCNNITTIPRKITRLRNLKSLDLAENKLREFPGVLGNLPNLVVLRLWLSSLKSVPGWLSQIQELSLNLSKNQLTNLPESISKLSNLKHLYLSENQLTNLPESISKLSNLSSLELNENQLMNLPESISKLSNLDYLNLSENQLNNLPESISKLSNLTCLFLNENQLTNLPESISKLSNLDYLNLSFNQLTNLPESISKLSKLTELYLSFNQLTNLPESISKLSKLTELYLSFNQLTSLPESITKFSSLTKLDLNKNPLVNTPIEVANKGIEAIRDYFLQGEKQGVDYVYEAKLLIVGEGGAGKTTLAKKIQNPNYQLEEEKSTEGIDVISWYFPYNNQYNFRMNIWDFGGQEIYHATHQFFLTKRSLYVLVVDTRKEDTDFYYWLNLVELLSDNSPLLIIKNEKQDREREINERGLRGQFTNLEKTLATNLKTNRGLREIIAAVKHYISNLSHVGQVLPKTWKRVREVLEQDSRDYISLEEYFRICQANGIEEQKHKLQLSGYLHDLGVCLHFQDDPLLKKTLRLRSGQAVILKPQWGTDAVYKVLDNQKVRHNWGRFTKQDLANIWQEQQYENARDELLQLMIKFKLCYQIPNRDIYIAHQLLTENQPTYPWEETNNLILRYTYEFMPKGIITQFIVAMHQHIWQQKYVWKNGVILEKEETLAEVIEYYGKREIKIRVVGIHKRDFLTTITYELDKIHDSYQRLKYNKWIPCNCQQCKNSPNPHFHAFENLRNFVSARQDKIQCLKSFEMVNVLSLIDDTIDYNKLIEKNNLDSATIDRQQNQDLIELAKILANKVGNKSMTEINIPGSHNTLTAVGDGNTQTGDVTATNSINQQQDSSNSQEIEQWLNQLKQAINSSKELTEKQKTKALEQVNTLTTAVENPTDEEMKEEAEDATTMLEGIVAKLPATAAFVTICKEILPRIGHFFGLERGVDPPKSPPPLGPPQWGGNRGGLLI